MFVTHITLAEAANQYAMSAVSKQKSKLLNLTYCVRKRPNVFRIHISRKGQVVYFEISIGIRSLPLSKRSYLSDVSDILLNQSAPRGCVLLFHLSMSYFGVRVEGNNIQDDMNWPRMLSITMWDLGSIPTILGRNPYGVDKSTAFTKAPHLI